MKELRILLPILLGLVACASPSSTSSGTSTDSGQTVPTPKRMPYWDLQPLDIEPPGGWATFQTNEMDLAFQYPSLYDEIDCGKIFEEDKVVGENEYRLIGFVGGTIRLRIFHTWDRQLDELAFEGKASSDLKLLTNVEQFSLGGTPARRHIYLIPDSLAIEYTKIVTAVFEERLYLFQYNNYVDRSRCDAPPLSEEAVFEHVLSTVEFIQ